MRSQVIVTFEHDDETTDAESLASGLQNLLKSALNTIYKDAFDDYGKAVIVNVEPVEEDTIDIIAEILQEI